MFMYVIAKQYNPQTPFKRGRECACAGLMVKHRGFFTLFRREQHKAEAQAQAVQKNNIGNAD